jgi:hypothetical protein
MDQGNHLADARYKKMRWLVALAQAAANGAANVVAAILASLVPILKNNVQRVGPVSAPGNSVHFDSAPYTLFPIIVGGGPAVNVIGSIAVTGTAGHSVLYQLVRDRGTGSQVILDQLTGEIGPAASLADKVTLHFLDTADAVDAITLVPAGLIDLSTHTYSIVATSDTALTGNGNALVLLEQKLAGTSVTLPVPPLAGVPLGTAGQFAALSGTGITNVGPSSVTGDIGTAGTYAQNTGWALIPAVPDGIVTHATSAQVIGNVYADDYAAPTPFKMTTANNDMLAAYTNASGRASTHPDEFNAGALGGQTLTPGVWKWSTAVTVAGGNLTLNGAGVYILIVAGAFTLEAARSIILAGGALPQNVFIAVAGTAALGAGSHFNGELLAGPIGLITLGVGATVLGRLLSQTQVTLLQNTIVQQ